MGFLSLVDAGRNDRGAVRRNGRFHSFDEGGERRLRIRRHADVDGLEALEVLVIGLGEQIDGVDADQLRLGLDARIVDAHAILAIVRIGVHRAPEVRKLKADDDVSPRNHGARRPAEIMGVGEVHAVALVDNRALQKLRQLHQQLHAIGRARAAISHDHRTVSRHQKTRRLLHRVAVALRRGARHIAGDIELGAMFVDGLLLQARIEGDRDGPIGRRHGDLVGAHHGLRVMLQGDGGIVPLGVVAHDGVDVLRGMEGRHARRARGRVQIIAADDDQRHPVAIGVVDGHGGVLQAHCPMDHGDQRLAGDLEIAMGDAHARFLVHAADIFGGLVVPVIDHGLMQGAEARGAVRGRIFDVERLDDVQHEIRAGLAADARKFFRRVGLGGDGLHRRRQGRGGVVRGGALRLCWRAHLRQCGRDARNGCAGQEFAAIKAVLAVQVCHGACSLGLSVTASSRNLEGDDILAGLFDKRRLAGNRPF